MEKVSINKVLALVDNDKGTASALLQMFIDLTPLDYASLHNYATENNLIMVGKTAHKMKSSIATLGMFELSELVKSLEVSINENTDLESISERISKIGIELDIVYKEMKELIISN